MKDEKKMNVSPYYQEILEQYLGKETLDIMENYFFLVLNVKELAVLDSEMRNYTFDELKIGPYLKFHRFTKEVAETFEEDHDLIPEYAKAEELQKSLLSPLNEITKIFAIGFYNTEEMRKWGDYGPYINKITKKIDLQSNQEYGLFVEANKVFEYDLLPKSIKTWDFSGGDAITKSIRIRDIQHLKKTEKGWMLYYLDKESQRKENLKIDPFYDFRRYEMLRIPIDKMRSKRGKQETH